VRAASLPTALPVAAAAFALVAAVLAPLAVPSAALAERWLRPVPGEVARPFGYDRGAPFAAGAHRGADLAAPAGAAVRAACAGRVIHAGVVAGHDVVASVRCRSWRVSYLPLASVSVRAGVFIRTGAAIGTLAGGHGGLHVGIRREGDPFGYEDPMALLPPPGRPFTPVGRPSLRRPVARFRLPRPATRPAVPWPVAGRRAPWPEPRPAGPPLSSPVPWPVAGRRAPWPEPRPAGPPLSSPAPWPVAGHRAPWREPRPAGRPLSSPAPWPVWVGLGLLLSGAAGSGTIAMRRRIARGRANAAPSMQVG